MIAMTRDRARSYARWLSYARVGLGASALLAPTLPARPWVGDDAELPAVRVLARSLGARDIAVGLGTILAMRHDAPARGWVEAGGLCDGGDLLATLLAFRRLPRRGRWGVAAAAAGAVATARLTAASVD